MTSVARRRELDESGDYSDVSHENDHNTSGNDAQPDSDYGDARGSESDSSERDGEEVPEGERQVDDDEDRSNPQYIPKRGTFYEHDDRTAASGGEESTLNSTIEGDAVSDKKETSAQPATERRRPPRGSEIIDKWSHDKFNEKDQTPKSREELVAIYGYDIRKEDAPPHARRNRRYGRGPNKYTRTWEDVEAYKRQALNTPQPNRKPPNLEDFPELDTSGRRIRKKAPFQRERPRSKSQPPSNESSERSASLKRNASTKTQRNHTQIAITKAPFRNAVRANNAVNNNANVNVGVGVKIGAQGGKVAFKDKLPNIENLTITASLNNSGGGPQRRVNTAPTSQQHPAPLLQTKKPAVTSAVTSVTQDIRGAQNAPVPNKSPPRQQALPHKQLNNVPTPTTVNKQELSSTQAAIQVAEARGSKRYSSLRQRALGDNYTPIQPMSLPAQATHHQHALINEYQAANAQQHSTPPQQVQQQQQQQQQHQALQNNTAQQMLPQQQQLLHQQVHMSQAVNQSQHGPSPPHQSITQQQHNQQVRLGMMEQQQMVSHAHHPIHNLPQQHTMVSSPMPQAQGYAPPAMMPAQFMQVQQSNNSGVFAAPIYAQPPPAPYTHQLYQHHNYAPPSGVTYYSPVEQEPPAAAPRATRRPTAAIPILKPNHPDRPPNPADTEKIDRLVDNMFVRKPWPVTPGGVDPKEKSDKTNQESSTTKETSQSPSMTSSSISTDSRPSTERTDQKIDQDNIEQAKPLAIAEPVQQVVVEESTKATEVSQSSDLEGSVTNA